MQRAAQRKADEASRKRRKPKGVAAQEARTVLRKRHEEEWLAKFDTWKEEVGEQLTELRARIESHLPKK